MNIWPSYKLYSSLLSLYYHHLISNLINLFCRLILLFSGLFKSHFRLSNVKTFRLRKNHTVHQYYTVFPICQYFIFPSNSRYFTIFFSYEFIYIEHHWLLTCIHIYYVYVVFSFHPLIFSE